MLGNQNGLCCICKNPQGKNRFGVDHNHACCSGEKSCGKCVRGLLCTKCNIMLGGSRDSIENLKSGISYLEKYNETSR